MNRHHVWSKIDIPLKATGAYRNPYTEVELWVDLEGPGFAKRIYGFWDGGIDFVVRVMATAPGTWRWRSGSTPADTGLAGKSGAFEAAPWSETELAENPNRRGMVVATPDGRGLQYADGTPFFLLGDTWWSVPSFRFPLAETDDPKPLAKGATLNDYVHYRKKQGFNSVGIMAMHPAWANDGKPRSLQMEDGTWVRAAWGQPGTESAKDMHNEGGRPFEFPGKVPGFEDVFPDMDRINPDYFKVLDQQDRLPQLARLRALHRGLAPRHRAGLEEVLRLADLLRPLRPVPVRPAAGEHRDPVADPLRLFRPDHHRPRIQRGVQSGRRALGQAALRHAALRQPEPVDAGQFRRAGRMQVARRPPDRQCPRTPHLLVSDRDPSLGAEEAGAERRALLRRPAPARHALSVARLARTAMPTRPMSAPPSMAASCPAASPASFMAAKASGRPTPKTPRSTRCGTRSSGVPPIRCAT